VTNGWRGGLRCGALVADNGCGVSDPDAASDAAAAALWAKLPCFDGHRALVLVIGGQSSLHQQPWVGRMVCEADGRLCTVGLAVRQWLRCFAGAADSDLSWHGTSFGSVSSVSQISSSSWDPYQAWPLKPRNPKIRAKNPRCGWNATKSGRVRLSGKCLKDE